MQKQSLSIPILILLIILSHACSPGRSGTTRVNFSDQWDTIRPLANPDKGWYQHMLDNGIGKYGIQNDSTFMSFPGMDHLYLRLAWAYLEPEEGHFNWSYIEDIVNKYVPLGYKVSFRISSKETGGAPNSVPVEINGVRYATPYWVRQAGAKGVVPEKYGPPCWTPDWDDPVYLEKLDHFLHAFAEKYDGKPWVRYIDVGSIGDWGEGHTNASTRIPPTVEEVKANIDVYLKNIKNTQLVVSDDLLYWNKSHEDVKELYHYAVSHGCTLRDDSPMVGWYVENYLGTWSVSHPQFYDPLYLSRPTVFELEHYRSVKANGYWRGKDGQDTIPGLGVTGAEIFRNAIGIIHPTYIGFHGYIDTFLNDNPHIPGELLNLCGYWYLPVSAEFPSEIHSDTSSLILTCLNHGVAPAYKDYSLIVRFEPGNSSAPVDVTLPDAQNTRWLPGEETAVRYPFKLPPEMKNGKYTLKWKLKDMAAAGQKDVLLGVKSTLEDAEHFITLGTVRIKR